MLNVEYILQNAIVLYYVNLQEFHCEIVKIKCMFDGVLP